MDERFRVGDPLRNVPAGITAETPAVSVAWRALKAEHQRLLDQRRREQAENERLRCAVLAIANEVHRIRRLDGALAKDPAPFTSGVADGLPRIADRIAQALAGLDIAILSPQGEVFSGELLELFDNVAQKPEPGIDAPQVNEVLLPAVTQRGALLQMGKVVIAIPER